MIRHTLIAALMAAVASPALALSCVRPDVAATYLRAAEAEETYIVVHGTLQFNQRKLPKAKGNESPPTTRIPARMTGKALTKSGFDHEFERNITLEVQCFGPWCGGAGSGETYLAFLQRTGSGYVMVADPCASLSFQNPDPDKLSTVQQCFNGGPCKPRRR